MARQALGRTPTPGGVGELIPPVGEAARRLGFGAPNVFARTFSLTAARTAQHVPMAGDFLYARSATSNSASLDVSFNEQYNTAIEFTLGQAFGAFPFDKVFLTNTAQSGQTITFWYGRRDPLIDLLILNPSSIVQSVQTEVAGTITTTNDVTVAAQPTVTTLLAANADRREAWITNDDVGNTIHIGDANVGGQRGFKVFPGQTVILPTTALIAGHLDAAVVTSTVHLTELET